MSVLARDLLIAGDCEQDATTALAACGIQCSHKSLVSKPFLKAYLRCQFSFHSNNCHIITYEMSYESLWNYGINGENHQNIVLCFDIEPWHIWKLIRWEGQNQLFSQYYQPMFLSRKI